VNTNLFYKPTDLCPTQDVAGLGVYIYATSNRAIPEQASGGTDMPSGYLQQFSPTGLPSGVLLNPSPVPGRRRRQGVNGDVCTEDQEAA